MHVFHIAEAARWEAAKLAGAYAWSTRGRTLEQEGFLHASREDQWQEVRRRYYADATEPLVLLVIDTDRLTSPWREEPVGDDRYPHIYGPLNPSAVVAVVPLEGAAAPPSAAARPAPPASGSFSQELLTEMTFRMGIGTLVIVVAVGCLLAGHAAAGPAGGLVGFAVGVLLGALAARPLVRRRARSSP